MALRKVTKYIVIHTTASRGKLTVSSLRAMHKARGFSDIGYGGWIDRNGKEQRGRGYDKVGAHVRGFNSVSVGVSWEGGFSGNNMTVEQEKTLLKVVKRLCKKYPGAKVCGHRDLSPDGDGDGVVEPHEWTKQCPWFDAEVWAKKHGLPHSNFCGKAGKMEPVPAPPDKRIVWLQRLLRQSGANIVADGIVGPLTRKAIKQFEADNKLPITGSFDTRATVDLLKANSEAQTPTVNKTVPIPYVTPKMKDLVDKAESRNGVSTTKITTTITGVGGVVAVGKEVADIVKETKTTAETFWAAGPWILLLVILAGGAWYIWQERNKKQTMAKDAREEADKMAVTTLQEGMSDA